MNAGGAFERYLAEIRETPLLSREEEAELARRARDGDSEALDRLVASNLRFVVSVARRYDRRGLPLAELVNEGNVGLVEAAKRFDESRGVRFVSYAVWWIRQSILGALARDTRIVHVPSGRVREAGRVSAASRRMTQRLGRRPRHDELAAETGLSEARVRAALAVRSSDLSLDGAGPDEASLAHVIADRSVEDPARRVDGEALSDALRYGLRRIPEREATIVRRYYGLDGEEPATLAEIAASLGISRERVGVLRERALARLRTSAEGDRLRAFRRL